MDNFFEDVETYTKDESGRLVPVLTRFDYYQRLNERLLNLNWNNITAIIGMEENYISLTIIIKGWYNHFKNYEKNKTDIIKSLEDNKIIENLMYNLLYKDIYDYHLKLNNRASDIIDLKAEFEYIEPEEIKLFHNNLKTELFNELGIKPIQSEPDRDNATNYSGENDSIFTVIVKPAQHKTSENRLQKGKQFELYKLTKKEKSEIRRLGKKGISKEMVNKYLGAKSVSFNRRGHLNLTRCAEILGLDVKTFKRYKQMFDNAVPYYKKLQLSLKYHINRTLQNTKKKLYKKENIS